MITENINAIDKGRQTQTYLRIIKQNQNALVMSDGSITMMMKIFELSNPHNEYILSKRFQLKHDHLIKIHKVQYSSCETDSRSCGILFEKYAHTLKQSLQENVRFTHEEVIQTFSPIKEVVDYLIHHNYDPGQLTLDSLCCDENYEIKFIDHFLTIGQLSFPQREDFAVKTYRNLANIIYQLLFPTKKQVISWKQRLQYAEEKLKNCQFVFLQELTRKFLPNILEIKHKPIRKREKVYRPAKIRAERPVIQVQSKKANSQIQLGCQSGKENVIIQ